MIVGILSDTHDQTDRCCLAVATLVNAGAEALLHCGDITIPEVVYECALKPSYFAFGNCDDDQECLRQAIAQIGGTCLECGGIIDLGGRRIAITHGHIQPEVSRLAALAPDYLFHGHSHWVSDSTRGPTRFVNPGALHRASRWTVGLLDLAFNQYSVLPISNRMMQD